MKSATPTSAPSAIPRATHNGVVRFGPDVECEAVVLANGQRGFNRRQLAEAIGFHSKNHW